MILCTCLKWLATKYKTSMEQFLPKQAYFIDATESIFLANYFEIANVKSAKAAVNYFIEKQLLQYPSLKTDNNFTKEVAPNILGAAISYLNKLKKPVKFVVEHQDAIYFYLDKFDILNEDKLYIEKNQVHLTINNYTILKFENMYNYFYNIKAYKCRKDKKTTLHIFNLQATISENINIFFNKVKKFEMGEML